MIGREKEQAILKELAKSEHSELAVVYGRRRVGKTFLVRETFNYDFAFSHAGVENGTLRDELFAFWDSLANVGWECERPTNWWTAFGELKRYLQKCPEGKKIVFLDELPWMDSHKSGTAIWRMSSRVCTDPCSRIPIPTSRSSPRLAKGNPALRGRNWSRQAQGSRTTAT